MADHVWLRKSGFDFRKVQYNPPRAQSCIDVIDLLADCQHLLPASADSNSTTAES
jgi:hypothetical protein